MTKEKGRHVKRLSRRRFLKILGGGAVYGAGGGLIGKGYQSGRDFYKSKIQPVVDKGQEVVDGFNKYNPLNLFKKPHNSQESYPKKEEKTDRRTFFQRLWSIGHEYPIETGITVGTVLGSGKTAVKDYFSRREKMKAAKALDDLEE